MPSGQLYYCVNNMHLIESMHLIEMSLKYICIILINQKPEKIGKKYIFMLKFIKSEKNL